MPIYGIDASSANKEERTGVENYAFHLLQALKNQPLLENEHIRLYTPEALSNELVVLPNQWTSEILAWKPRRGWMALRMALELLAHAPDMLFVPSQGLPFFCRRAIITTIHDLGFIRHPELYSSSERRRQRYHLKRAIRLSKRLLTVSEFTKQELVTFFQIPKENIVVTPLAVDRNVYQRLAVEKIHAVLEAHRISPHFFLSVGRLEKKKNISTIIRAFEWFKSERGLGDPFELVLIGKSGFGYDEIKKEIQSSRARDAIRELHYQPDEAVAAFMSATTAFLFPSFYEGFGMPILEAMSSGAPVIASDIPVHREVAADAAMFVRATEPEAWAKSMRQMAEDQDVRAMWITKGGERCRQFSWDETAKKTLEVFRSLV